MLDLLEELLRNILMNGVDQLKPVVLGQPSSSVTAEQVSFDSPDDNWRTALKNLNRNALNVYLVDLRENRKLRSNELTRHSENGVVYDAPAPARLDCHYLISGWSPTDALTPQLEPTADEHRLLYQAAAVLMNNEPFNPSRVYPAGSTALQSWEPFDELDLPAVIAPTEGFPKLAEFWGTMGSSHPWKPVLYLIVTIPVELVQLAAGPMVTTSITEFRQGDRPETAEVWVQIGGTVFDSAGDSAGSAWVRLETTIDEPLQTTETSELGQFTFVNLRAGHYQLRARVSGSGEVTRLVDVPSLTGEYDIVFPPATADVRIQIGGTVFDNSGNAVVSAWTRLETTTAEPLQTTEANELGQFTFVNVHTGHYQLRAQAVGLGEVTRSVDVPSPTGEYDLKFP